MSEIKLDANTVRLMLEDFIEDPDVSTWITDLEMYSEFKEVFDEYREKGYIDVDVVEIDGKEYAVVYKRVI